MREIDIFKADTSTSIELLFADDGIRAGFPSPSQDYMEKQLDLNQELISHPAATFLAKVVGLSMINAGIDEGDILVIDRSLEPRHDSIVVAYIDGEFTVKRLDLSKQKKGIVYLRSESAGYPDFKFTKEDNLRIWGVVSSIIKRLQE